MRVGNRPHSVNLPYGKDCADIQLCGSKPCTSEGARVRNSHKCSNFWAPQNSKVPKEFWRFIISLLSQLPSGFIAQRELCHFCCVALTSRQLPRGNRAASLNVKGVWTFLKNQFSSILKTCWFNSRFPKSAIQLAWFSNKRHLKIFLYAIFFMKPWNGMHLKKRMC